MQYSGPIPIFPIGIYKDNIGVIYDEEYKSLEKITFTESLVPGGNLRSESMFILELYEFKRIRDYIQSKIDVYTKEILGTETKLHITISWLNENPPGSSHHLHNHPNSIISGVFYFRSDVPITFHRTPYHKIIDLSIQHHNEYNSPVLRVDTRPGDLLIFPSDLLHHVDMNMGKETRISLAFNTFVKGDVGSPELLTYVNI